MSDGIKEQILISTNTIPDEDAALFAAHYFLQNEVNAMGTEERRHNYGENHKLHDPWRLVKTEASPTTDNYKTTTVERADYEKCGLLENGMPTLASLTRILHLNNNNNYHTCNHVPTTMYPTSSIKPEMITLPNFTNILTEFDETNHHTNKPHEQRQLNGSEDTLDYLEGFDTNLLE